jgi:hypothetical protein
VHFNGKKIKNGMCCCLLNLCEELHLITAEQLIKEKVTAERKLF